MLTLTGEADRSTLRALIQKGNIMRARLVLILPGVLLVELALAACGEGSDSPTGQDAGNQETGPGSDAGIEPCSARGHSCARAYQTVGILSHVGKPNRT